MSETETKGRENVSVVGFVVGVGVVSVVGDLRTEKIEPKNILTRLLEFFFDPVSEKLNLCLFWILLKNLFLVFKVKIEPLLHNENKKEPRCGRASCPETVSSI